MQTLDYASVNNKDYLQPASSLKKREAAMNTFVISLFVYALMHWLAIRILFIEDFIALTGLSYDAAYRIMNIIVYVVIVLVQVVFCLLEGRTYGMKMRSLMYVDRAGMPIKYTKCARRFLLGVLLSPAFILSSHLMTKKRDCFSLADRICKTMVVFIPPK